MKRKVGFLAFVFIFLLFIEFNVSVKCADPELEVVDFYSCDQLGNFQEYFERGANVYFNLTIRNLTSDPKNVSIDVNVYDECAVPIDEEFFNTTIPSNGFEYYIINCTIPPWAYVGMGTAYAYIWELLEEKATNFFIVVGSPPSIDTPSQEPEPENIMPNQEVTVSVNVTDAESGVKNVTLSYTTNGGFTWTNLTMLYNATTHLYQATIPAFPAGTSICYKIIAYDNAGKVAVNDNAGQYYCYQVNPSSSPVGGIYIPVNKLELLAPYIGLTILLAVAVISVGYVKKRKRNTEINS